MTRFRHRTGLELFLCARMELSETDECACGVRQGLAETGRDDLLAEEGA